MHAALCYFEISVMYKAAEGKGVKNCDGKIKSCQWSKKLKGAPV